MIGMVPRGQFQWIRTGTIRGHDYYMFRPQYDLLASHRNLSGIPDGFSCGLRVEGFKSKVQGGRLL